MANVLVTGGGRGLGLELARQLAEMPESSISKVFVTTRGNPSAELCTVMETAGKRVVHIKCEVIDNVSVQRAAAEIEEKLQGGGLDILINNVGVSKGSKRYTGIIHINKIALR
jgi:NAD(P)-dependent dehydrogenase (short-subunit alcohol dehydrogenase family)